MCLENLPLDKLCSELEEFKWLRSVRAILSTNEPEQLRLFFNTEVNTCNVVQFYSLTKYLSVLFEGRFVYLIVFCALNIANM